MQKRLVAEMEERMMKTLETAADPEAMLKSWFTWGSQGMEQFQRFMREAGSTRSRSR